MNEKVFKMLFANIYNLYCQKVARKGRTQAELDTVITWLTGYDALELGQQIETKTTLGDFLSGAPQINPKAKLIRGTICGCRVEDITDPLVQKMRYMDKLVDELAQGKKLESILRQ